MTDFTSLRILTIPNRLCKYQFLSGFLNKFNLGSLRWRILSLLGLIMGSLILLVSISIGVLIYRSDQQEWRERQIKDTAFAANKIEFFMNAQWKDLETLANLTSETDLDLPLADILTKPGSPFLEIVKTDEHGQILYSASQDSSILSNLFTVSQSAWFNRANSGEKYISEAAFDAENNLYVIMAVPDNDKGVVAARLRMDILVETISDINFGELGEAYIANGVGNVIAHQNIEFVNDFTNVRDYLFGLEIMNTPGNSWQGAYTSLNNQPVVGTSLPIAETNWIIIVELPQDEAFRTTYNSLLVIALGSLIFAVIASFTILAISNRMLFRPLGSLQKGAEQFGNGQLHTPINIDNRAEISSLAKTFNQMAVKLQDREAILIEARNQAESESSFKTRLLATVSHELRTPLGGIMGVTEMLEYGLYGPLTDDQATATTQIIASTEYLSLLVNDLLDHASYEAGQLQLINEPFVFNDIIEKLLLKTSVLAQRKDIYLNIGVDADVPAEFYGDERRLLQIFINLTGNAIKFTEKGGVEVHVFLLDKTHWSIQVSDTGVGIPPNEQKRIFEPFRQMDNSVTRRNDGTGLGLSIVKDIVAMMNGTIELESQPNEGSRFTVTLPIIPVLKNQEPTYEGIK